MAQQLSGASAFVTGASRGIGAATAVALARSGAARVVIQYGRYKEGAERTLEAVRAAGAGCEIVQADLDTEAGIDACVAAVKARPEIDILVNNAGSLVQRVPFETYTRALYEQVMNLNVKSVWELSQAAAGPMIRNGRGVIVNVSSIAARTGGGPGATVYAAAKAAVSAMTKGLARELAPKGIRVNAISPGTVDNYFHQQFSTREMLEKVVQSTPLGRLADNEEMADAILFLCSDGSRYIIGQTIELNGGMFMV
ncbi:MAG: SDR family oxidoreductase [Bryobacteraceae bacterium]|nr:SDR family oxidoreductase [Bryobacteraceae bacterium]